MSNSLIFEAEPFELSPPEFGESACHRAKWLAQRTRESAGEDEAREEVDFEEEPYGAPSRQRIAAGQARASLTVDKIIWVQHVLNRAAGEGLKVDGKLGPVSRAAVQRFQSANRLKDDGMVGQPTETALIQAALNTIAKQSLLPVHGLMDPRTVQEIRRFQSAQRLTVDGRVGPGTRLAMIRALGGRVSPSPPPAQRPSARGGASVPPSTAGGKKYTSNLQEVVTTRTTPTAREVVDMLRNAWPELTENGARTLTAQFMGETGGGRFCFNWNLGNVKEPTGKLPHMYLRNVWEVITPAAAEAQVNQAGGLARIATDAEVKKNGWSRPAGREVVVFNPPHSACRFRAYANLQDGAQRWVGHHQRIARLNSGYLDSVNAGDTKAVAHALKMARYYTAGEADYARVMATKKAEIDRALGAI